MPVALVTGASRGIGKACAVHLADAGFDVALGARTMTEGEAREHSSTIQRSDTRPLPGSLATTAALVEERGRRALPVFLDLLDRDTLGNAVNTVIEKWGAIDLLVNNGRYIGPGHMDRFLDTPIELLERQIEANVIAPMVLAQLVLPQMIERGKGVIIDITSAAGYGDPPAPAGDGGWGMGYGVSKGGFHRIAGVLAVELAPHGIRAYNVQPGFVATERMAMDMGAFGFDASQGAPPDVVGAVVAWLVTDPEAESMNGVNIEAQDFCRERGLVSGWGDDERRTEPESTEPIIAFAGLTIDRSGREVRVNDEPVELTAMEFDLLAYLAAAPRRVVTREELLRDVWDSSTAFQDSDTVTEHVRRVRHKIEADPTSPIWITTVRGVGYRFEPQ